MTSPDGALNPIRLDVGNPGPMTGDGNGTYLLPGPDTSALLIDAGVGRPSHLDDLTRTLVEGHRQLTSVLVTHIHADHASGAPAIAVVHQAARFHKFPHQDDSRYAVRWQPMASGSEVETVDGPLIALHTPGHSPDHVVFWHPASRTVFSGDLVVLNSSVVIDVSGGGSLAEYLGSLTLVLGLDAALLLPAHGPSIVHPPAVLQACIDHRHHREQQVLAALTQGRDTVTAIAESIYDGLAAALMPAARHNVRAHLEKLRHEQRAFEDGERWIL